MPSRGRRRTRPVLELGEPSRNRDRESETRMGVETESVSTPVQPHTQNIKTRTQNIDPTMDRIAQMITTIIQNQNQSHRGSENTIERARNLGAQTFNGVGDYVAAETWLTRVERVFEVMGCSDEQKLSFATFLLEDRAYHWWRSVQYKYSDPVELTWARFRIEFLNQYCSRVQRDAKRSEFYRLEQGGLTVEDYANKFIELSRFVPSVAQDEVEKCRRFEEGLRGRIRTTVTVGRYQEFGELVEAAMRVERSLAESDRRESLRQKRSGQNWSVGGPSTRIPRREGNFSGSFTEPPRGQGSRFSRGQGQTTGTPSVGSNVMNQRPWGRGQRSGGPVRVAGFHVIGVVGITWGSVKWVCQDATIVARRGI